MKTANLFGPFVGELKWEFFRFAPYAIFLKKRRLSRNLIVLTRSSRFDLYGQYADVFVPLNLKEDKGEDRFGLWSLDHIRYKALANMFYDKYSTRYRIVHHFYPDIRGIYRRIKWQFPRKDMDYDFLPRPENTKLVDRLLGDKKDFALYDLPDYEPNEESLSTTAFVPVLATRVDNINTTVVGSMIEVIRRAEVVIGNLDHIFTRLALLLEKPVILVGEEREEDIVNLFNPLRSPVLYAGTPNEAIEKYLWGVNHADSV